MTDETPSQPESQVSSDSNTSAPESSPAPQTPPASSGGLTEKQRNLIIIGAIVLVLGLLWSAHKSPQNGPGQGGGGGGGGEVTLAEYLVGTWQAQTGQGQGEATYQADGSFAEQMQYPGMMQVSVSRGSWSVSGSVLTVQIQQSDIPQRVGGTETVQLQPVSKDECKVIAGQNQVFVMRRVR